MEWSGFTAVADGNEGIQITVNTLGGVVNGMTYISVLLVQQLF